MSRAPDDEGGTIDAGPFHVWLDQTHAVLRGEAEAEVPCNGCTACCESSQFVLVEPDEHDARSHIPAEVLFPAPGMPEGFSLIPYDEHGRCAMFRDGGCSIYEHRPRTCRAYDCRVLAAAGVDVGPDKVAIGRRVRRWEFRLDSDAERRDLDSVRSAATFLEEHGDELPGGTPPPTQRAAMAVELAELFTEDGGTPPTAASVVAAIRRNPRPDDR